MDMHDQEKQSLSQRVLCLNIWLYDTFTCIYVIFFLADMCLADFDTLTFSIGTTDIMPSKKAALKPDIF